MLVLGVIGLHRSTSASLHQWLGHTPFETLWTVACQASLSMELFRQEDWGGLPLPFPGDLPNPGIEPAELEFNVF